MSDIFFKGMRGYGQVKDGPAETIIDWVSISWIS